MEHFYRELINIAQDIYNHLGPGYNEVIYHKAFEVALRELGISYQSEVITPITYKGHCVGHGRVDIMLKNQYTDVNNWSFIIEFKAVANLTGPSIIQLQNYLKHYNFKQGFLINFGYNGLSVKLVDNGVIKNWNGDVNEIHL